MTNASPSQQETISRVHAIDAAVHPCFFLIEFLHHPIQPHPVFTHLLSISLTS